MILLIKIVFDIFWWIIYWNKHRRLSANPWKLTLFQLKLSWRRISHFNENFHFWKLYEKYKIWEMRTMKRTINIIKKSRNKNFLQIQLNILIFFSPFYHLFFWEFRKLWRKLTSHDYKKHVRYNKIIIWNKVVY